MQQLSEHRRGLGESSDRTCPASQYEIRSKLVHVISQKALREFGKKHPDVAPPLRAWLKLARHGHFQNLAELKLTFASIDMVGVKGRDLYVVNIGGKKYRLIAAIHFNSQRLFVRHILTHSGYVAERWKK
jgi:mRNA interferase HigB